MMPISTHSSFRGAPTDPREARLGGANPESRDGQSLLDSGFARKRAPE
jgi:hypothetical protein